MKVVSLGSAIPINGMAKLREIAKTHGRDSDEYRHALAELTKQVQEALQAGPKRKGERQ